MMPNREIMEHEVAEVYRKASDTDRAIISHALGGETQIISKSVPVEKTEEERPKTTEEKIEEQNRNRILLLSKKYAFRSLTIGEQARLDLLQDKISYLMPRVTEGQIDFMSDIVKRIKSVGEEIDKSVNEDYE